MPKGRGFLGVLPVSNQILRYFAWQHLTGRLQSVSQPFAEFAARLDETLPDGPEKTVALRKLLESKDAAVRSALPPEPEIPR